MDKCNTTIMTQLSLLTNVVIFTIGVMKSTGLEWKDSRDKKSEAIKMSVMVRAISTSVSASFDTFLVLKK